MDAQDGVELLSDQEARPGPGSKLDVEWKDKLVKVKLKPHNWNVEKQALLDMAEQGGAHVTHWVEALFDLLVDEATLDLRSLQRQGMDPDLVWRIAREAGWLKRYREVGFRLMPDGMGEDILEEVVVEVWNLERRLRKAGFDKEEINQLTPDQVHKLYELDVEDDKEQARETAKAIARILSSKHGVL